MLLLVLAACQSTTRVHVRALIPSAGGQLEPTPGVALVALPYDRDSIIAALAANATSPRPDVSSLDSLFARFRRPFAAYAIAADKSARLQDSLGRIKTALDSLPRESPAYRARYGAFVTLGAERAAADRQRDSLQRALKGARDAFGTRSDSTRLALREWEDSTYRDYEKITQELARNLALQPAADTTGADGTAALVLKKGRWWIYARSWDALDPNAEWVWNVPVRGDSVSLSPDNARHRPRY
jgi:hypothetical protein